MAEFTFQDGTPSSTTIPVVTGDEDLDTLLAIKSRYLALMAQAPLQPKVTYSLHGHSYSWNEFQKLLPELIASVNRLIQMQDPFEIVSLGRSI